MFSFIKKIFKSSPSEEVNIENFIKVDLHSHLLPGIDDGSQNMLESASLIKGFKELGYQKLITTPHIMGDFYRNTPEIIHEQLHLLKAYLKDIEVEIEIEAAAEYYLDEWFIQMIEKGDEILTFGNNYVLFETSFMNKPQQLLDTIFKMQSQGYQPVLAHPERYTYLYDDPELLQTLRERGVLFQINLNSLTGYYSRSAQHFAEIVAPNSSKARKITDL